MKEGGKRVTGGLRWRLNEGLECVSVQEAKGWEGKGLKSGGKGRTGVE